MHVRISPAWEQARGPPRPATVSIATNNTWVAQTTAVGRRAFLLAVAGACLLHNISNWSMQPEGPPTSQGSARVAVLLSFRLIAATEKWA